VTGDGAMSSDLGHGSIKPHNITYWKEKRDPFNSQRLYRLRVEGGGQTAVLDGIPPLTTLSIYHKEQGQLGIFWPGMRQ
jgi:hypothetical protein